MRSGAEMAGGGSWDAPGWEGPPPEEICIVMLSAIGDAVHVLPVVNALKRAWPHTRITWVIQPVPHLLVDGHPAIDEFILFRRRRGLRGWMGFAEFARDVRERRFDLLLGLQVYLKAGVLTALAPSRVKLGFDRRRARDMQWLFTDRRIPERAPQHVQDQYFEFLRYLGVPPEPVSWGIHLSDAERERQAEFFETLPSPACAVVVGTSKREKNWMPERYARVLEEVQVRHGLTPVLVGGPSAIERELADDVVRRTSAHVVDALGDDLRRLVWILEGSTLSISPDTGPLHISRAVGTPVVGLYGYTNPKRTGPYGAYQDLVVDGYAAHPGEDYPLEHAYRDGMHRVTVEGVLEKVAFAMERYRPPGQGP
ncbi:MAG: glycosyltransferase family 9 protein [Gemmatimonadota bacterium]